MCNVKTPVRENKIPPPMLDLVSGTLLALSDQGDKQGAMRA